MNSKPMLGRYLAAALLMAIWAGLLSAQTPLFTFNVDDLEGTERNTIWLFDFDSPSFPTHDGNWYSFGDTPIYQSFPFLHYYAEDLVRMTLPGNPEGTTLIGCVQENVPFTGDPSQIGISFSAFNLTDLERVNLVNPGDPWQTPGESGDIRTYANSNGYITLGGANKLRITNMQYEITTPYPTGQEIHDFIESLAYPIPYTWNPTESIGPGIFFGQTGSGTGLVDPALSDPAWAALFEDVGYVVTIEMRNIVSRTTQNSTYHDFDLLLYADTEPNVPVVLSSFTAGLNAENLAVLNWSTASESDLIGFRVFGSPTQELDSAYNLTPVLIPAQNSSSGADYSFTAAEFDAPGTYWFWLESIDISGNSGFFGPISVTINDAQIPPLPDRSSLGSAYPNPFVGGASANILVEIKAGDSGELGIYNLAGQRVASFPVQQGVQTISWDGLDPSGKACASGVYFYRLNTGSHRETKKLILFK
ncbi:MAG: T9SS type A sorting domain-containing protein [Candidatus Cloacimonetes bacterium]|nr:T9SS type A sorting domain-containing protein [Candidatus Cloacimonadota bacterium]